MTNVFQNDMIFLLINLFLCIFITYYFSSKLLVTNLSKVLHICAGQRSGPQHLQEKKMQPGVYSTKHK